MTAETPPIERLQATPILVTASIVQLTGTAVFLINAPAPTISPGFGWVAATAATGVAAVACWRTAATPGLRAVARRLWRSVAVVAALVMAALGGDARRAFIDPYGHDGADHDAFSTALYVLAMVVLLYALLRLPVGGRGDPGRVGRFVLDSATVGVTTGIFAWYLTMRSYGSWSGAGENAVPMMILAFLGLIGSLAFVKIAMSGLGGLDRVTIRLLAAAAGVGAAGGGLLPLLVGLHHGLSASHITVPATMLLVVFAADRQRRAAALPPPETRRRPLSVLPYVAVAATDVLLLVVSRQAGELTLAVAVAAVSLTALVVAR